MCSAVRRSRRKRIDTWLHDCFVGTFCARRDASWNDRTGIAAGKSGSRESFPCGFLRQSLKAVGRQCSDFRSKTLVLRMIPPVAVDKKSSINIDKAKKLRK